MSQLIQQSAIVKKTDGEFAWVSPDESSSAEGCSSCSSKNSCGSTNFLKPLIDKQFGATSNDQYLKVKNSIQAEVGDKVLLELHSHNLLKSTFLAYLLPLISLFIFAILGRFIFGEVGSALLGVTGLFMGLYLVKYIVSNTSFKQSIEPVMVSVKEWKSLNHEQVIQPY